MPKTDKDTPESGEAKSQEEPAKATSPSQDGGQTIAQAGGASDPVSMLKADHRKVEALFDRYQTASGEQKSSLIEQVCDELIIHSEIEEKIFYPACRKPTTDRQLDEAQVEHDAAKVLILELMDSDSSDRFRDAKFKVLAEEIRQHIREEEAPDGVLAKAQKAGVNTRELGERLAHSKQQLQQQADAGRLPEPRPVSFQQFGERGYQETRMPMHRDDQGRFTDDDDDRRGGYREQRSYQSSRGGGRGHGGWFGDPEGHSRASREGWDEREGGSRGRSYAERGGDYRSSRGGGGGGGRGHGGWFGDPEGHSQASREGWQHSSHEGSGWYGDPQGHSQASREGWRHSDHEGSGWYGDPQGHSEASRRGWRQSDHEGSGWYGDPQGHSEASRRGWDDRGGSRMRGRDDDDRRGGRGGGGRGHGGWFGDPEGHSRASREGWDDRR